MQDPASKVPLPPNQRFYEALRQRIVSGEWAPGQRIPNRVELRDTFDISLATMQKALDALKRDGFIRTRGQLGTFVADRLPSRYRVGLAFGVVADSSPRSSRMLRALDHEAQRINQAGRWEVRIYDGAGEPGSDAQRRLIKDVQRNSLAGVFMVSMLAQTPVMQTPDVRLIALTGDAQAMGLPRVSLEPYIDRVVTHLVEQRRRRPGIINSALRLPDLDDWRALLAARGLEFDRYHAVTAHPADGDAVRVAVYHMMQQPKARRPDALFVTDDHMVEPVTEALCDVGIDCPEQVLVVAHCNYPLPPPHRVPVTFIGYDLAEVLSDAVAKIAPFPEGEDRPLPALRSHSYTAKFQDELSRDKKQRHVVTPVPPPPIYTQPPAQTYATAPAFG